MPSLAAMLVLSLLAFALAHRFYGRLLARLFGLDASATTPAHVHEDGEDYVPTPRFYLLSQHFSAISAAGPIVGPILAAIWFGWAPAFWWILLGCIFIGAMHDFAALVGSVRHGACSIAQVLKRNLNGRSYTVFTIYIWLALIYVIIAFTDVTARAFVEALDVAVPGNAGPNVAVAGAGVASSSMLYLGLSLLMGVVVKLLRPPLWLVTVIFMPAVGLAIWLGPLLPLDLHAAGDVPSLWWAWLILVYCGIASVLPMWLLLQPRGYLGGFFLYLTLGGGLLGLLVANPAIEWPAFTGFTTKTGAPLVPFLFITIACGACSGFHGLVCSGTTSKQIDREPDAHLVGYGGMLLEGVVALLALACVMILKPGSAAASMGPEKVFGVGIGSFLHQLGVPLQFAVTFGMLAFATFVYDTLDVCTRLARYLFTEFTGWRTRTAGVVGTVVSLLLPAWFVAQTVVDRTGTIVPAYRVIWPLFGSTNQLLAGLTLVGLSLWLANTGRSVLLRIVVGVPMVFMMAMTMTALVFQIAGATDAMLAVVACVLLALAVWITGEAVFSLCRGRARVAVPHETGESA
ncbi:MAG TPA: carbon starvation CstA family protein [Planctomycetota bacterium]|nr:carbon starvation CstA family protein [Planctomycetota bacterium]